MTATLIRLAGGLVFLAGIAAALGGFIALRLPEDWGAIARVGQVFVQLGAVLVVGGLASIFLSRRRGWMLPNEASASSAAPRPPLGGWLLGLGAALVALPLWLLSQSQTFFAEWGRVADFLGAEHAWTAATSDMGGLVILPLAAVLTPLSLDLAAVVGVLIASAVLLLLMVSRTPEFPRAYLACAVLLTTLVFASYLGGHAATTALAGLEPSIDKHSRDAAEAAEIRTLLTRHVDVVTSMVPVLVWVLCGYLLFVPAMLLSRRVSTTFAYRPPEAVPRGGLDIEAITRPPEGWR